MIHYRNSIGHCHRFQRETGIKILEGYGLTEGGCVSTINPPAGASGEAGTIGIRLPWQRVLPMKLDADGRYLRDAAVDEVGVICINGPNLFEGYLNPEHSRIWVTRPGEDGKLERWLNTGDLGRIDANGYFRLSGRQKELIIRGGHNIDPRLIEECLQKHPSVALAAAVGRPDEHSGEVPVAYFQLRPDQRTPPEELLRFAQSAILERAAWPKEIRIVPALPTTAVGKIFKPALMLHEAEALVTYEAQACGAALSYCEAVQDPRLGLKLKWSASARSDVLRARLDKYAFHHEQIDRPEGKNIA
jgi:fatty-acyl-CoA synthase